MIIEQASIDDAKDLLDLQKLAYKSEANIYNDAIPPLTQTLEQLEADFNKQLFIKACINGNIVGSVRAYMKQDTCLIGRLIVHPDFQNQGIGTKLMNEIEKRFNQARKYELFTGHKSDRNLYLYQKLGYSLFKSERTSEQLTLLYLKKKLATNWNRHLSLWL